MIPIYLYVLKLMKAKFQIGDDGIIDLPIDFWNTTNDQINQMNSLLHDIISKALENPTSIEVLDKAWFDSIFYNVIRYTIEF